MNSRLYWISLALLMNGVIVIAIAHNRNVARTHQLEAELVQVMAERDTALERATTAEKRENDAERKALQWNVYYLLAANRLNSSQIKSLVTDIAKYNNKDQNGYCENNGCLSMIGSHAWRWTQENDLKRRDSRLADPPTSSLQLGIK